MEAECERAEEKSRKGNRIPIFSTVVKENSETLWKRESILVITDYSLDLYSPETVEQRKIFVWMRVEGIEQNDDKIKIKYNLMNITIESFLYAKQIFQTILYILLNIHTRKELIEMKLTDYLCDIQRPTAIAILSRIEQLHAIRKDASVLQIYDTFNKYFIKQETVVDLSDFNEPMRAMDYLFDIVPLYNLFKTLIIPDIPGEIVYDKLYEHTGRLKRFECISIKGRARHFCKFFEKFQNKTNMLTCGLEFTDTKLKPKHMAALAAFCDCKRISSLSFHNAFRKQTRLSFYTNFFTPNMMTSIAYLNLDYTKKLDISNIVPNVPNLVYFSVAYCELLVEDILDQSKFPNIRTLIANGNKCERLPPTAIQLPRTLTRLDLADVEWGEGTLTGAFKLISMRTELGMHVDFSNAHASHEEFERTFADIKQNMNFPLLSLKWNGNKVDKRFIDFLLKNNSMNFLSMDNIFNVNSPNIDLICDFITSTQSVNKLSIRGGNTCYIGASIRKIVKAVNSSIIEDLDISDNKIPDSGINALKGIFTDDTNLKFLSFDGCLPEKSDAYIGLIDAAAQNRHIKISFPFNDLNNMRDNRIITGKVYTTLLSHFQSASADAYGRTKMSIRTPARTPYTRPYQVYVKEDVPVRYMTKYEADKLRRGKQSDFLSFNSGSFSQISMDPPMYIRSSASSPRMSKSFMEPQEDEVSEVKEISNISELPIPPSTRSRRNRAQPEQNVTPSAPLRLKSRLQTSSLLVQNEEEEEENYIPSGSPKKASPKAKPPSPKQDISASNPNDIFKEIPQELSLPKINIARQRRSDASKKKRARNHAETQGSPKIEEKQSKKQDRFANIEQGVPKAERRRKRTRTFGDADFENEVEPQREVTDPLKELRKQKRNASVSSTRSRHSTTKEEGARHSRREQNADFSDRFKEINPEYLKYTETSTHDSPQSINSPTRERQRKSHIQAVEFASDEDNVDSREFSSRRRAASERRGRKQDNDESISSVFVPNYSILSSQASEKSIESHKTYGSRIRKLIHD